MRRLRYLPSAQRDFVSILDAIARKSGSVTVAERFVAMLRGRCRSLAALPGTLGRQRSELRPDMRSVAFRDYVIFFRYQDGALEIINVVHGHRDLDAFFDQ